MTITGTSLLTSATKRSICAAMMGPMPRWYIVPGASANVGPVICGVMAATSHVGGSNDDGVSKMTGLVK